MKLFGIEKIHVYPGSLSLSVETLCAVRGLDSNAIRAQFLVDERAVMAPWEDTVTMAVNAAAPLLTEEIRASIGLLIVATETSVDQEKAVSSWVHHHLSLPPDCRNFEVKQACYGATAGLQMALAWLASGLAGDRKALVINADASLMALEQPYEAVLGCGACAVLLSSSPRLLSYELNRSGVYAHEINDVIRPTPRIEAGGGELSLFSYLDSALACYNNYLSKVPEAEDFDAFFQKNLYHVPFGEITFRAHRALLSQFSSVTRANAKENFERKVLPSLTYNRRMGGTYGASTFIALLGLCANAKDLKPDDRIGIFAYGSGSCAEFYSALLMKDFGAIVQEAGLAALLDRRRVLSVKEYELCELTRDGAIGARDFTPDREALGDTFQTHYAGQRRLVLDKIEDYRRCYSWS
jgi:hydroxymethylglutaryl-CoA synthase